MKIQKVLVASPNYSAPEKNEAGDIRGVLGRAGFSPESPGFNYSRGEILDRLAGCAAVQAYDIARRFMRDAGVYQACELCDATVVNLNGRTIDESSLVLAAYTAASGKPVVVYKNDGRTCFRYGDHPTVEGLDNFRIIHDIKRIPWAIRRHEHEKRQMFSGVTTITGIPKEILESFRQAETQERDPTGRIRLKRIIKTYEKLIK